MVSFNIIIMPVRFVKCILNFVYNIIVALLLILEDRGEAGIVAGGRFLFSFLLFNNKRT